MAAELTAQVTIRMSPHTKDFYEELARKDRRKLADMMRLALEDHAAIIAAHGQQTGKRKSRHVKDAIFD